MCNRGRGKRTKIYWKEGRMPTARTVKNGVLIIKPNKQYNNTRRVVDSHSMKIFKIFK